MRKFFFLSAAVLFLLPGLQGFSQVWEVPADQNALKNPSAFNNENVKAGRELYNTHCKSCHGDPGKNNALPLVPPPPDVTSEQMLQNSEGALFYKITTGRVAMPAFETTLTEEQRWRIVSFMKSFDPANEGLLVKEEPVKARLQGAADETAKVLTLSAQTLNASGEWMPLPHADLFISAKRTFGSLAIGQAKTNGSGHAEFKFPEEFKGDREGLVDLEVTLGEEYSSDPLVMNHLKIAAPADTENLFADRVLWSTNDRTQWWLILAYLGVVGGVWLVIGYVIFQILKIYKAGKE